MDYLIMGPGGSVGIQRKSGSQEVPKQLAALRDDILPSLKVLTDQMGGSAILLIEEDFVIDYSGVIYRREDNALHPTSLDVKAYFNFIHSIKARGIDVVTTRNLEASIWWMIATYRYLERAHYPGKEYSFGRDMQAFGSLCCINSIGPSTAEKLLSAHTLQEIISASEEELKLYGLNANQIYNIVATRSAKYAIR